MKLNDIPKHNIYKVPEGYFERLPSRVMEQTAAKAKPATPLFGGIWRPVRLALAPLVLLIVVASVFLLNYNKVQHESQPATASLSTVPEEAILAYLDNYPKLRSYDFEELAMSDNELTAEFLNISSEDAEKELENYQLNNLIY